MTESKNQQIANASDNVGQAVGQTINVAKNLGLETAKQAATKGAEATANAATATVKAGVEGGKVVAEVAAGTASGGPIGAVLSAVWAMRHTLFKVLIFLCLAVVFWIVFLVELPGIVMNQVLGIDGKDPVMSVTSAYESVSGVICDIVHLGYNEALQDAEDRIRLGGYDEALSMNAMINHAQSSAGYDVAYIMSAYSTSVEQTLIDQVEMKAKLLAVSSEMFPVTAVEREGEISIPVTYHTYKPITVTIVTEVVKIGTINDVPQYRYETAEKTFYEQDRQLSSDVAIEVDQYTSVSIMLPIYRDGSICGTYSAVYYLPVGKAILTPSKRIVKYLECTIHPFDHQIVAKAFGLDLGADYPNTGTTYDEVIRSRALAMKQTLYGMENRYSMLPLTEAEIETLRSNQNVSETRSHIVKTALSLVGRVPYFWGGKSPPGWNDEWNTPKLVILSGSVTSGTIRPYGLDCSGFTDWVYQTAVDCVLDEGIIGQYENTYAISEPELLPGDLGFLWDERGQTWYHVLIFVGYGEDGRRLWVHATSGEGVVLNTPTYDASLCLRRVRSAIYLES